MTQHKQVRLTDRDGRVAEVDELMAPLISALWKSGYTTQGSCQEQDGTTWPGDTRGAAWVGFASKAEAERFPRIAANGAIILAADPDDPGPDDEALGYTVESGAVAFPTRRLDDVTRRVRAAASVKPRRRR